jgi:flagellar biosynthesis/type III secretory pathway protein FliH
MSEPGRGVPLSRLFGRPQAPCGPPPAELQQQAVEAAFEAGRATGEAALLPRLAALEAELSDAHTRNAQTLATAAARADAVVAALDQALAGAVATLALAIARQVLGAEPTLGAETIHALVAEALAGLPAGAAGVLRMNPADAAHAPAVPTGWIVIADAARSPGDVLADCALGISAAGLSLRLDQVRSVLEEGQ